MKNLKPTIPSSTVTRDLKELDSQTGNIYESLAIISRRANQISNDIKEELQEVLSEYMVQGDSLEEVFENREQIELSKTYERMPKPTLIAIDEFISGNVYYRNPEKDNGEEA